MTRHAVVATVLALQCALGSPPVEAGQTRSGPQAGTAVRSADDRITVSAVRVEEPLDVDGRLDEAVYTTVPPISGFIQHEPRSGEPATEKTELWILFDRTNVYVSARCWDSHPEREIANEMRRDGNNVIQDENLGIIVDAYHDRRNGLLFNTNILGARRDSAITDESSSNGDWNTVWDARTARFANGWTIEVMIPFKSLRYNPGPDQIWGINVRRTVRWKSEISFLSEVPSFLGINAIWAVSRAANLVGVEVPSSGKNLEIKPYAISALRTDRTASPSFLNRGDGDVGVDVKYGVTRSLTFDATYNTDFAQVEDDVQQVNLTRFSLFYPERRDFFLEGQGIFAFGGVAAGSGATAGNAPVLFFSRRIGLNNGRPVPVVGGARLTGKAGPYSIGILDIQSGDEAEAAARPTNFATLRLKRDLFGRSNVGAIYTRRDETGTGTSSGTGAAETFGVDALYSASRSLNVNAFVARTRTPGVRSDDMSHLVKFDYNADRYGLQMEHLAVGSQFNPAVGFLRRSDFRRQFALARFSPRPARTHMKAVRRFLYQGSFEYVENGAGTPELREAETSLSVEFLNTDLLEVSYLRAYELIPQPFSIASGVTVPRGGYNYQSGLVSFDFGTQHPLSGTLSYRGGSLYGGTKHTLGLAAGRLEPSTHFAIEPSVSVNWVALPNGDFTSSVVSVRNIYSFTPRMFVSALVQYNSSINTLSTNARFRWEYRPGSELFLVYSDGRDTVPHGMPELLNRAFVVKLNRLFRF